MKIIIGTLLFTLAVLFNSIELSSSSSNERARATAIVERIPRVFSYSNEYGQHIRVQDRAPPRLAFNEQYIYGVIINGGTYPLFNRAGHQVMVYIPNRSNVRVTEPLWRQYAHLFTPLSPFPDK